MGLFGRILATPVRLVNAPLKAVEKLVDPDAEEIVSRPLEALAEAIEESDGDD